MRIMQSAYSNFSKNAKGRKSSISFARKAVLALLLSAALCVGIIPAHADPDIDAPVLTHTLSSEGWTKAGVTVNLSVTDNGGSGVSQVAYKRATDDVYTVLWSGSQDAVETSFSTTANGAYKVRLVDVAGNDDVRDVIINTIDRTAPTFSSVKTPGGWTAEDVTVTISATDAGGSGVNKIWYKVPGATDFTLLWSNADPANNHPTSQAASFIAEERGRYRVKIADVAGNEYTGSVQISNIDRTVPDTPDVYVTNTSGDDLVEINGRKWSNEDVMVHIREAEQIATSFLTFSSPNAFTLSSAAGEKTWDGILEYSTNLTSWTTWDGTTSIDSSSDATHVLYVRGTGNTIITGAGETVNWVLDGSNIECSGNIEYLLDYNTAATGGHPAMGDKAFRTLFEGCSALTSAPELPAEEMTESCYAGLFRDCVNLDEAPELPATTLAPYCYNSMFRGCTGLTMAPELNAATMADYCYQAMFYECTGLIAPPALPATTLAEGCYQGIFFGCSNMVDATELPAATLAERCYARMFEGCNSLAEAPELSVTTLAPYCYDHMFSECASLTTAPELPATTLAQNCYLDMFNGCTNLATAPELPATTLASACYYGMFQNCTSLTTAPELPATTLVENCYYFMFSGCTSLTTAPELPATTLANSCYADMFIGCTSLATVPELPATTLANECYYFMFRGCTNIKLSATKTSEYGVPYRVPISGDGVTASGALTYMFAGTGGTFTGTPEINRTYYLWGRDPADTAIKFSSEDTFTLATANGAKNWDGSLEYSTDLKNWTTWDGATTLNSSDGTEHVLYVRGTGNSVISGGDGKGWTLTGSNISCSGNIENLLDHETVTAGEHPSMGANCYCQMFLGCTSLTTAPELPATTLAERCYSYMFINCPSLTAAPELPATTLAYGCYSYMFQNCTSLTTAPELPVTTLASHCYNSMFKGCMNLTTAPELPATTLAYGCYLGMFYGCTSLTTAPALPATSIADQCYHTMFYGCTSLTTPPELPATTLKSWCYRYMFQNCTSLTTAPELPATSLASYCYADMFYNCTSLTAAPELPATSLASYCYVNMFKNCTSLTTAPELPATTLANYCYQYMFQGCTGIKLSATKTNEYGIPYRVPISGNGVTASNALSSMFSSTGGTFRGTPIINRTYYLWGRDPADTAIKFSSEDAFTLDTANGAKNWDGSLEYSVDLENWAVWDGTTTLNSSDGTEHVLYVRGTDNSVISGGYGWTITGTNISCSGNIENLLNHETVTAGEHPSMGENCYSYMFFGCASLTTAPELPSTTMSMRCYEHMFSNCTSLTTAPELPATTLAEGCYESMFSGCTSLTTAPDELPATTLAEFCYYSMFEECTSLTAAPELPATTLAKSCYSYMFLECTSLATAPDELPATTLAQSCYDFMFGHCRSLTTAPELPATTLAEDCYSSMFESCSSLTTAPELPATTLAPHCYAGMFADCTSLTTAPELPATTLAEGCYSFMFSGCTGIKLSSTKTNEYGLPYRVPISGDGTDATDALTSMFDSTGGTFTGTPEINRTYYLWGRDPADTAIKFSSDNAFTLATANGAQNWDGTLEYSTDLKNWTTWDGTTTINSSDGAEHVLYVRGTGNSVISGYEKGWTLTGTNISCTGNIENLLDYATVAAGEHPSMGEYCYSYMFDGCTSLATAPELPATTLGLCCYGDMFSGCTSLTTTPELPATTLTPGCYSFMFAGCTSLTTAPELPATTLASECYATMFSGCTSLTTTPELPATTLAEGCYSYMFSGCTSLTTAPELPATTLTASCYSGMFYGCTSLTTAPELPATTLAERCYESMFEGCTSLATAHELPATTVTTVAGTPAGVKYLDENGAGKTLAEYIIVESSSTTWGSADTTTWYVVSENVEIAARITVNGDVRLLLCDNKTLTAKKGITVQGGNSLTIYAQSVGNTAGVLDITTGTITANAAGIGGMSNNDNGTVIINGGIVNVKAGSNAAGIGGGYAAGGGTITINGGIVSANGGSSGAGIGTGVTAPSGTTTITINGGTVTATNTYSGTGLGTGSSPNNSGCKVNIAINGGDITAINSGSSNCPAIGAGYSGDQNDVTLNIAEGATIEAGTNANDATAVENVDDFLTTHAQKWVHIVKAAAALDSGTDTPKLPATTLAPYCYNSMFKGCTSLTTTPELPATTLAIYCYANMFDGCTGLTTAPELPATTLAENCYNSMFRGCTSIKLSATKTNEYGIPYRVPVSGDGTDATDALTSMFDSTGGTFTGTPEINTTYYLWGRDPADTAIKFSSEGAFTLATKNSAKNWDGTLEYSTDLNHWTTWDGTTTINSSDGAEYVLYVRGTGNSVISGGCWELDNEHGQDYGWTFTGTDISCSGSIENLLDYATVIEGGHPSMGDYCFDALFVNCANLTTAPELPATTLANHCYHDMFNGCTGLVLPPVLPATALAQSCYRSMFMDCTSLTTAPELPAAAIANDCYYCMFYGCTSLTTAPELPATTLAKQCYRNMFLGCTSLTAAPELPATTLADQCYWGMFQGCTSLTTPPELPATTLADGCYYGMFRGCTGLATPPELPATTLAVECYRSMFQNCTSLKLSATKSGAYTIPYRVPSVGSGTTASNALTSMFTGTGGTFAGTPSINTTYYLYDPEYIAALKFSSPNEFTLATKNSTKNWNGTLEYSTDLDTWNTWDGATTLNSSDDVEHVLYVRGTGNTYITGVNSGPDSEGDVKAWVLGGTDISCSGDIESLLDYATVASGNHPTMGDNAFEFLFYACAGLTSAEELELPATMLTDFCYCSMFHGCTSLITAPELPATTLARSCYYNMFLDCSSLTTAPELPATTLAEHCYRTMFKNCASLSTAPELPATTLAERCYYYMFERCSLTTAPELPATTLAQDCYRGMFENCTSLAMPPELPATALANNCYRSMFHGCTSLTTAPELPATTLVEGCYYYMFDGCTSLKVSTTKTGAYTIPYRVPSVGSGTTATNALTSMFSGTGGTFTGTPSINTTYYLWDHELEAATLKFSSPSSFSLKTANSAKNWDGTLQYSTNLTSWSTWSGTTTLNAVKNGSEYLLYLRGTGNSVISGSFDKGWTLTGSNISCSGNIENLLNHETVTAGEHPSMGKYCYSYLFLGCTNLIAAPELPATTLAEYCYDCMFCGCTSLTTPPELPATTLEEWCYTGMFRGCTSLTTAPELPATTLASSCYFEMFKECTSLTTPPCLPATTLAEGCYRNMFTGCTDIKLSETETDEYNIPYRVPVSGDGVMATDALSDMFASTGGTFTGTPSINTTYYLLNPEARTAIKLSSPGAFTLATTNSKKNWDGTLQYSTDLNTWNTWDGTTTLNSSADAEHVLYVRGAGNSCITGSNSGPDTEGDVKAWVLGGTDISCSGDIENLLDYATVTSGNHPTVGGSAFEFMFYDCAGLTSAECLVMPASAMANYCCCYMFYDCVNLVAAPKLPATTLANNCYWGMFKGCTSLTTLPDLPATTLATECYNQMFYGCTSLKLSTTKTGAYTIPYRVPKTGTGTTATNALYQMFTGTGGTFTGTPSINTTYYLWDHELEAATLKFSSPSSFSLKTANSAKNWDGTLQYSTDLTSWSTWSGTTTLNAVKNGSEYLLYLRGTGNSVISGGEGKGWTLTGSNISCSGNIENLLDYEMVKAGEHPSMGANCYRQMFYGCTSLTTAPELPATTLAEECYRAMFSGCTSLTTAPELPTTTLAEGCYWNMFYNCTSLTIAPELPATTLADWCYWNMFYGCTSLTTAPELPAATLAAGCYRGMFYDCTSLTAAPELPATTLAENCYYSMFCGCTNLTTAPELPATTLAEYCYYCMFSDCTSLTSAPDELPATTLANSCYRGMFQHCTSLTSAPELPATTLSEYGYHGMFYNCTSLTMAPELPATTLAQECYRGMFQGCTSLTTAPELPATTLAEYCYSYMFYGCTSLATAPELPATTLAPNCYESMFDLCASLTTAPELPATTMYTYCYWNMFRGCTSLTTAPELPATTLAEGCYKGMFYGCTSLTAAPELPATTLAGNCYYSMFCGCTNLTTAPELPATTLAEYGYYCMFSDCTSLTSAPDELPATTLANSCYRGMFQNCTSLTTAPELPATTLAEYCYRGMFYNCTSLTMAPELPATTLAENCYDSMFAGCTSLTMAPELPATTLAADCYKSMFWGCTGLTTAPELPATTLAENCYYGMFCGCTSLTMAPELPATTLAQECYRGMFEGCTSLTSAPELPATTLAQECYHNMFYKCTGIKLSTTETGAYTIPYRVPSVGDGTTATDALLDMFTGTGGTFAGTPSINTTYYLYDPEYVAALKFSSPNAFTLATTNSKKNWDGTLEYSTDLNTWTTWDGTTTLNSSDGAEHVLYVRGTGNSYITHYDSGPDTGGDVKSWVLDGADISCSGNIENLLDYATVTIGNHPTMDASAFEFLFYNCHNIVSAEGLELPATTMTSWCYKGMFLNCTGLNAPPQLPATTLAEECYMNMFKGCTSLTTVPELPATTLTPSCYNSMFNGCTGIKLSTTKTGAYTIPYRVPKTGSGTTASSALYQMFTGTGGTFTGTPSINTTYYLWDHELEASTLKFSSPSSFSLKTANSAKNWNGTLQYSTNLTSWSTWSGTTTLNAVKNGSEYLLYLRGTGNSVISGDGGNGWTLTGSNISCSGNIENLLDYEDVTAGEHPSMGDGCYNSMFAGCTSLITAPELPANTLSTTCYSLMFSGTSLITAPKLPANTLSPGCYSAMFGSCTSLTTAPELPATTLAEGCYYAMFYGCTSLTTAPELPATTLAEGCYSHMFWNCPSLTTAPELPATTLAENCYEGMFLTCRGIKLSETETDEYNIPYRVPVSGDGVMATDALSDMFTSTGGPFTGTPNINTTYYLLNPNAAAIKFSSPNAFTLATKNSAKNWNGTLEYSTDLNTWNTWDGATTLNSSADAEHVLYVRGTGNSVISGGSNKGWTLTGTNISCTGNIENLLDYATVAVGEHPSMGASCYDTLFLNCTSLTTAPELPATTLVSKCYYCMFYGCTNLMKAPELPATTLADKCYWSMFQNCSSIVVPPSLPATTLTEGCYYHMFDGCTSLKLSRSSTGEYTVPYRIPTAGTGTKTDNSVGYMFDNTGGTFTGTPSINAIYYLAG